MPLPLHHLAVVVRDLQRAEQFYSGLLGLPVQKRWDDAEGRPRSVWVGLGQGAFLAIELAAAETPVRSDLAPGFHCLALAIEPAERARFQRLLEAAGVAVEKETAFTFYVRDPDGNLVGLSHYPHAISSPEQRSS